jgi:hypothetical protein
MPLPEPEKTEKLGEFIKRCMANPTMNKEFPDRNQRAAVCRSQYEKK